MKKLGMAIKKLRLQKNITQAALAKECGIGDKHLSNIETGHKVASLGLLTLIYSKLGKELKINVI